MQSMLLESIFNLKLYELLIMLVKEGDSFKVQRMCFP